MLQSRQRLINQMIVAGVACMLAVPADAWDLRKQADSASTSMVSDGIRISLMCRRNRNHVDLLLTDISGGVDLSAPLKGMTTSGAMMMWIELPDGRTSRDSFSAFNEQGSISAIIPTDQVSWDFFANGQRLWVQDTGVNKKLFESGMKGTGAARLAFKERCGI